MTKKPVLTLFIAWACVLSISIGMFVYAMILAPGQQSEEELAQTVAFYSKFIMGGFLVSFFMTFSLFYWSFRYAEELTSGEKMIARIPVAAMVLMMIAGFMLLS